MLGMENGGCGSGIDNLILGIDTLIPIDGPLGRLGKLGGLGIENGGCGIGIASLGITGDGSLHLLMTRTRM